MSVTFFLVPLSGLGFIEIEVLPLRNALSHHNVVSLTVSPSLPLRVCHAAPSSETYQINRRFWSLTLREPEQLPCNWEEVTWNPPTHTECVNADMSFKVLKTVYTEMSWSRKKTSKRTGQSSLLNIFIKAVKIDAPPIYRQHRPLEQNFLSVI